MPYDRRHHASATAPSLPDAPVLSTERLELEPLRPEHADEMAPLLDDVTLHEFIGGAPATVDELRVRYARQVSGASADGTQRWCSWIVRLRATHHAAGTVQATVFYRGGQPAAELAWVLARSAHGHRYAVEAGPR